MSEEIVLFPCLFLLFGFVVWTIFDTIRRYKTAKLQAGLQTKLLEKFGSGQELLAYVQSDAGNQLMESLTMEQRTPHGRILGAAQVSIIMVLLALALLFLRGRVSGGEEGFLVSGTIVLSLGVGFGLSAALSYFLSKSFGLLNDAASHRS
jgi:hypothetical protein